MNEREIFIEALRQEGASVRQAYLEQACGADAGLRDRVEVLLQAHGRAGSFLEPVVPALAGTCELPVQPSLAAVPGTQIGPYKLLQQIGEGGMGTVFMAEQTHPVQRKVAVKVIKAGMDSRQVIARFEAERQALALMDHVNIARVLDAGCIGVPPSGGAAVGESQDRLKPGLQPGLPYFVMELVHGVSIIKYCDDNQLTPRQRLELFVPVCQAIQHAHQKGVIHRDIKPSNVMITLYDGKPVPKVIDFGVAKAMEQKLTERTLFTQYGTMVGTLEYTSPEQAEMSALGIDTRSDIYSLGVLLYELLTGSTPLSHKRVREAAYGEILRMIREDEPPKPSTRLTESGAALASISAQRHMEPAKLTKLVRGELDWIVMKTLEKDRNRRYETAIGLARDVQHYLNDEPVQACPPSALYRFGKFARRNKPALLTTAAVATALIFGTVASTLLAFRAVNAEGLAQNRLAAETEALKAATEARAIANDAKNEAVSMRDRAVADTYRALLGETRALREARPAGWRATALDNLRQLGGLKTPRRDLVELRSEAVLCLGEMDAREIARFERHTHLIYGLDFSPDGNTLATAGYDGKVFLWDLGERRPVRQLTDSAAFSTGQWTSVAPLPVVRFRPDGGCVAYSTWSRQVEFLGWKGAPLPSITSQAQARDITFEREGNLMAVSWGSGQVGIYDARTGALKRMVDAHTPEVGFYMPIALSPAGDLLATRGPRETIQLFRVGTAGEPAVLGPHGGRVRGLAFSSDGRFLASASDDRTAKVWTVSNGKEVLTLQGHTSKVNSIAFSPDDELIATGSDDGTLRLWEAQTGQSLIVLNPNMQRRGVGGYAQGVQAVAFSRDGTRIAAASEAVVVYELTARPPRHLAGHGFFTSAVAFHPVRPVVATASRDSDVTLWDLETGRELRRWTGLPGMPGNLSFNANGSLLVAAPFARLPTVLISDGLSVYETEAGQRRWTLPGRFTSAVAFDPSGRLLAAADRQGAICLWDFPAGELVRRWHVTNGWIADVAFIRGGSQLVIGDTGGLVLIWDMELGRKTGQTALPGGLVRFAVDPAGHLLAAANFLGDVRIMTLPDLRVVATLESCEEPGLSVLAFSHDGQWLAIGGADRRVTIWDASTFEELFTLPLVNGSIYDLSFQSNGPLLGAGAADELIPIWNVAALQADLGHLGLIERTPFADDSAGRGSRHERLPAIRRFGPNKLVPIEWQVRLLEHALEIEPDQPSFCAELAWIRVMGPKALRDPEAALPLARRAVELAPNQADCLNTLGAVYYRLGRWDDAIETLQAAAAANPAGASGYDLFFLAMSYQRRRQAETARELYDRATQWWAGATLNAHQAEELATIQAEAELTLEGKEDSSASALELVAAGQACVSMSHWSGAAIHFARAAKLAPLDPQPWAECGKAHAHLSQWPDALRCFAKAVDLKPDDARFWYYHAIAHVGAGDLDGYRKICSAMVDRFRNTNEPALADRILYTCLPLPDAMADVDELVRLAEIVAPSSRGNVRALGAALYRAGRYELAIKRFDESAAASIPRGWDWLFRAMAHARLDQLDEAGRCFEEAARWIEEADRLDVFSSRSSWFDWFEQVEVRCLRGEAEELLGVTR